MLIKLNSLSKAGIYIIAFLSILVCACVNAQVKQLEPPRDKKIDSVLNREITFLKACLEKRENLKIKDINSDSLTAMLDMELASVEFFEQLTGINANTVHNYIKAKVYDQSHIKRWENWVAKNRELIIWESHKHRLNRKDRDIYQEY